MALNVKNLLWTEDNRKDFEARITNKEQSFIDFFKNHLREFVDLDYSFSYRIWKIINFDVDKNIGVFDEEIKAAPKTSVDDDAVKDTANAQEWLDIYFPKKKKLMGYSFGSEVWSIPRSEVDSLIIDNNGVLTVTDKKKTTSLFDTDGNYNGLEGDLDLSDFKELKELNISRNPNLGKVDISECLKLESLFMNSDPHQVVSHKRQMKVDNLIVTDKYLLLKNVMWFGSDVDNMGIYNKLISNDSLKVCVGSKAEDWWSIGFGINSIKKEIDSVTGNINSSWDFSVPRKSQLYQEIKWAFELFEVTAPQNEFDLYFDTYQYLADEISGKHITELRKTTASGTSLEFEKDASGNPTTVPLKVKGGDFAFAKILNDILNPPISGAGSWASFQGYIKKKFLDLPDKDRLEAFKKYFGDVPENKVDEFFGKLTETLVATIDVNHPDRGNRYLFPSEEKKISRVVRGNIDTQMVQVPKGVDDKKRFKEIVSFEEFKKLGKNF